jgi:hypothetical protein
VKDVSVGVRGKLVVRGDRTYHLAFSTIVLLQHLHVRVFGKAVLADGREIGRLPTGSVEILLDLRRHDVYGFDIESVGSKMHLLVTLMARLRYDGVANLQLTRHFLSRLGKVELVSEIAILEQSISNPNPDLVAMGFLGKTGRRVFVLAVVVFGLSRLREFPMRLTVFSLDPSPQPGVR